jgi:hypothetical protein
MADSEPEIDETGRNPTQRRMDDEGTSDRPADAEWEEGEEADEAD